VKACSILTAVNKSRQTSGQIKNNSYSIFSFVNQNAERLSTFWNQLQIHVGNHFCDNKVIFIAIFIAQRKHRSATKIFQSWYVVVRKNIKNWFNIL